MQPDDKGRCLAASSESGGLLGSNPHRPVSAQGASYVDIIFHPTLRSPLGQATKPMLKSPEGFHGGIAKLKIGLSPPPNRKHRKAGW